MKKTVISIKIYKTIFSSFNVLSNELENYEHAKIILTLNNCNQIVFLVIRKWISLPTKHLLPNSMHWEKHMFFWFNNTHNYVKWSRWIEICIKSWLNFYFPSHSSWVLHCYIIFIYILFEKYSTEIYCILLFQVH